jgi:hypothetical protein
MKAYTRVKHRLTGEEGIVLSQEGWGPMAYVQTVPVRLKDYSIKNFEWGEIEEVK